MSHYLGIDFGTWTLKAAATENGSAEPRILPLADGGIEPFLPVVARADTDEAASWELFRSRRSDPSVVHGFRDRTLDPIGTLAVGGVASRMVDLQVAVLRGLQGALGRVAPQLAAFAVSIPDHWPTTRWAMPVAMGQAGWNPILCAREWVAVLAAHANVKADTVLLISAGAGDARATCCTIRDAHWTPLAQEQQDSPRLSGDALRGLIANRLENDLAKQLRRIPSESAEADQALSDAIEKLLRDLVDSESAATLQAELFGQHIARSMSRTQLAELAASFEQSLGSLLDRLLKRLHSQPGNCHAIVWGELTSLLPIADWLARTLPTGTSITVCDPDIVARGMARLGALTAERQLDPTMHGFAGLQRESGAYVPNFATQSHAAAFPLLERLPITFCSPSNARMARLIRLDDEPPQEKTFGESLRIGRDPRSDWLIDDDSDEVSRAHAVIVREGNTYVISDLGSMNGTFLNDHLVQGKQPLADADMITLGQDGPQFRFELT